MLLRPVNAKIEDRPIRLKLGQVVGGLFDVLGDNSRQLVIIEMMVN